MKHVARKRISPVPEETQQPITACLLLVTNSSANVSHMILMQLLRYIINNNNKYINNGAENSETMLLFHVHYSFLQSLSHQRGDAHYCQ